MTAIVGYSEVLSDPAASAAERADAIESIRRNSHHVLALLNDMLDYSKLNAGAMMPESIECDLAALVRATLELARGRAEAGGIYLQFDTTGPLPALVHTDPTRLRQILGNLLANAVRFTRHGGVRLTASCSSATPPRLRFDVIDTGIGIPPERQRALFQPFQQGSAATAREYGGTGLGLTISRELARMLGGDVTLVSSTPGRGSHFRAEVPLAAPPPQSAWRAALDPFAAPDPPPALATSSESMLLSQHRVLLAEDALDTRRILGAFLRRAGAHVDEACNGADALERVVAALHGRRADDPPGEYDVILMDMEMPVMNGFEATRVLRERGYLRPILALTANAMPTDRAACLAAGCNAYCAKPVSRVDLVRAVAALCQRAATTSPLDAAAAAS